MTRRLLPTLLLFVLLTLTLRMQSIWWDEGISLHLAGLPWRDLLLDRASNIHPPLYFVALKVWAMAAGRTPFTGRYLSVLAATLLPAVVQAFLRGRVSARTGHVAGLLIALAPPVVVYGQEVRAYIFLPLFSLVLWAHAWPSLRADMRHWRGRGVLLGIAIAALLLTHYGGVIALGGALLAVAARLLGIWRPLGGMEDTAQEVERNLVRLWLTACGVAWVLLVPWAVFVLRVGTMALQSQAGLGNVLDEPAPWFYVLRLIMAFQIMGMPQALADPLLMRATALVGAWLGVAVLEGVRHRLTRSRLEPWAYLWLIPLLGSMGIWWLSPQSHPRYLYALIPGGWMLIALLTTLSRLNSGLRMGLLAAVLVGSVLGIRAYLVDPRYARTDVRAVAAFLRQEGEAGDVVLIPHTDWSLVQYDIGLVHPMMVPEAFGADDAGAVLLEDQGARRVFALDYERGALDAYGSVRAALTWHGRLVARQQFQGVFLEEYLMEGMAAMPPCRPLPAWCAEGGGPCLVGVAFQEHPISGAALPMRLCWDGEPAPTRLSVALRLYDSEGVLVAAEDDLLLDVTLRGTDHWDGKPISTYHLVPLPVGLAPLVHRLEAGLYEGNQTITPVDLVSQSGPQPAVVVGSVRPRMTPWQEPSLYLPEESWQGEVRQLLPGLQLEGHRLSEYELAPGGDLVVTLLWRREEGACPCTGATLALWQGEQRLTAMPLPALASGTPPGRPLLEHVRLTVPSSAKEGLAQLLVEMEGGSWELDQIRILEGEHRFELPPMTHALNVRMDDVAVLRGYEVTPEPVLTAGAPCTVTLIWEAGPQAATQRLKVFVHLVTEAGTLVAQHDAEPALWHRPTTGWVPGEIIEDVHPLTWLQPLSEGPVRLRVGLYHGDSGARIPWETGSDALDLPLELRVQSP